jgi:hypothetical protein
MVSYSRIEGDRMLCGWTSDGRPCVHCGASPETQIRLFGRMAAYCCNDAYEDTFRPDLFSEHIGADGTRFLLPAYISLEVAEAIMRATDEPQPDAVVTEDMT